ncbi:hypothetical protein Tco_1233813 [Tanacetum coccineum]
MPSSPEPMIGHFDDLDFFKEFENEFLAITYNDDLTSKLTEPCVSFQHIKEFDLNNETSLSKHDEEERNVLYFNDSFPLNIIFPNNLKSKKDIDDDEIDVTQSLGRNAINIDSKGSDKLMKIDMASLPSKDQRHPWLMYQTLGDRLRMVYTGDEGQELFTSYVWRRLFKIRAPLVREFILEFLSTCRMNDTEMGLDITDTLCFQLGGARPRMTWRQFILVLGLHTDEEMAEDSYGV